MSTETNVRKYLETLPKEMITKIANLMPRPSNREIAQTAFWSQSDREAYRGIKDGRYNNLPEYQKDLAEKIFYFGDFKMVQYTLNRWYNSGQSWEEFIIDYDYGKGVNPYAIKKILKEEENKKKWFLNGGIRLAKMRTKRRIYKKHNTKKRRSKKHISKKHISKKHISKKRRSKK